jgi:putative FmdB family regulatory protein
MPIYEYRCEACGHQLESIQKFSDEALTDCPSCGKPALKKLISAAGFHLKGSGWYATDSKSTTKKPEPTAEAGESKKPPSCGGGTCGGCAH